MIEHSRPTLDDDDLLAIQSVITKKYIAPGTLVNEFENHLANYIGQRYCFATNSGTSALHLALIAIGIKETDHVIIPNLVCPSVLNPIYYLKAKPILIDTDPNDHNIDMNLIEEKDVRKSKAIIIPYKYGYPIKFEVLKRIREINGEIRIIEDCAHALGSKYKGTMLGNLGDISIFSFYATKMITSGVGGAVCTSDLDIFQRIEKYGTYYSKLQSEYFYTRYNYKMTDLQASLALNQLKKINKFISRRKKIAKFYKLNIKKSFEFLKEVEGSDINYYRFIIRKKNLNLDNILEFLYLKGIKASIIDKPLNRLLNISDRKYINSIKAFEESISIPIYPSLLDSDVEQIVNALNSYKY